MSEPNDPVRSYIEALYAAADALVGAENPAGLAQAAERLRALDPRHPMLPALEAKRYGRPAPLQGASLAGAGVVGGRGGLH